MIWVPRVQDRVVNALDKAWVDQLHATLHKMLKDAKAQLGKTMTKAEVRRLPRIKQRGAAAAPQLLKMYLQHPEIHFPGLPPPAEVIQAENDLHYLELLLHGARGLASHLQDAARARRAFIWRAQMDVYAVLKRLRAPAQVPPGVQSAVQHLQKAMKLGPRVQTHTVTRLKKPLPRSKKAIKELARKAHQAEAGPPSKR